MKSSCVKLTSKMIPDPVSVNRYRIEIDGVKIGVNFTPVFTPRTPKLGSVLAEGRNSTLSTQIFPPWKVIIYLGFLRCAPISALDVLRRQMSTCDKRRRNLLLMKFSDRGGDIKSGDSSPSFCFKNAQVPIYGRSL